MLSKLPTCRASHGLALSQDVDANLRSRAREAKTRGLHEDKAILTRGIGPRNPETEPGNTLPGPR